jgi:toluene monooxygenase system ferredoxin subunit
VIEPVAASAPPVSDDIVAGTGFFAELAAPQRARVASLGRIETHRQDTPIYNIGDAAADFYVLVDGMVRFSIGLGSRRTAAGQVLRRGEVFGWAALVEQAPQRIASAFCITSCTVLAINGDQLLLLMEADHSLGFRLMKQLNVLITSNLTSFASG